MSDDADNNESTTDPLPVVSEDVVKTTALVAPGQGHEDAPTNPLMRLDDAAFDELQTFEADARKREEYEEDMTIAPGSPFDAPTNESQLAVRDDATLRPSDDDDPTETERPALRRPARREPPRDATRPASLLELMPPGAAVQPGAPPTPGARERPRTASQPFWKKESFWQNRPATRPAAMATITADRLSLVEREQLAFRVALAVGTVTAVATFVLAIFTWMSPGILIGVALLAALPVAGATAWFVRPEDLSTVTLDDARPLLRPVAAGTVLVLIGTFPWQFGFVRGMFRGLASTDAAMVLHVLTDRSDAVALDECVRAAPAIDNSSITNALATALPGRPEVMAQCVAAVPNGDQLSRALLNQWGQPLLAGATAPQVACGIAQSMAVLPAKGGEIESRLLSCVADGAQFVRGCCATALLGRTSDAGPWLDQGHGKGWVPNASTATALLRLGFAAPEVEAEQLQKLTAAGFTSPRAKTASLKLACRSIADGANLGEALARELKGCETGLAELPKDREVWAKVCRRVEKAVEKDPEGDPPKLLCTAAKAEFGRQEDGRPSVD